MINGAQDGGERVLPIVLDECKFPFCMLVVSEGMGICFKTMMIPIAVSIPVITLEGK